MGWNQGDNNGGPWGGGGNQNPWGNRGRGSRNPNNGPDLDAMLRESQERFKAMFPGGGSPKGTALLIVIGLLFILALQGLSQGHFLGFYRINDGEVAVVQRFGAYVRQDPPGLRWLIPLVERYTAVSTSRSNVIQFGAPSSATRARDDGSSQQMMLTGDANILDMEFTVQWRVNDPVKFLFNMRDPDITLRVAAESVMREVMGQSQIMTAIGSGREAIRQEVEKRLRDLMVGYNAGINVDSVQLQRMEAPGPVIDAFIKAQNAQQEANTTVNQAEGYRNSELPKARAEANRLLEEARAYKAQVTASATGDADRFSKVYSAYKSAEKPTATRMYLETMEQVLGGANKVIVGGEAGQRVLPYLPLNELKRTTTQGGAQ